MIKTDLSLEDKERGDRVRERHTFERPAADGAHDR